MASVLRLLDSLTGIVDGNAVFSAVKYLTPMLGISQIRIQNEQAEKIKEHLEQLVTETFKKSNINTKLGLSRHRLPGSRHRPDDVKKIVGMIRVHSIVDVNHKR